MPKIGQTSKKSRSKPYTRANNISKMQVDTSRPSNQSWSAEADETLISARASGMSWQPIAEKNFPTKTANACRKRHERLMEKRNADDLDGPKLEKLAQEYMNVREEMWSILGARLGEKWQVVEQKCMEKGIKNLQSASRSAVRKERGSSSPDGSTHSHTSYSENEDFQDDSGISVGQHHHHHHHHHHHQQSFPQQQQQQQRPTVQIPPGSYAPQTRSANLSIQAMLSPSPGHGIQT